QHGLKRKRLAGSEAQWSTRILYRNNNPDQIQKSGANSESKTAALKPKAAAPHMACAPPASSTSPVSAFTRTYEVCRAIAGPCAVSAALIRSCPTADCRRIVTGSRYLKVLPVCKPNQLRGPPTPNR